MENRPRHIMWEVRVFAILTMSRWQTYKCRRDNLEKTSVLDNSSSEQSLIRKAHARAVGPSLDRSAAVAAGTATACVGNDCQKQAVAFGLARVA